VNGKAPVVAGVMMDLMTKVLEVDKEQHRMRVEAQMTLKGLYEAADANGLSTPRSALPWWQGLTLAGALATGSHGTGNNVTSMIVSPQVPSRQGMLCSLGVYHLQSLPRTAKAPAATAASSQLQLLLPQTWPQNASPSSV